MQKQKQKQKRIVVIGAGVSGLTTALLLSKNPRYSITVAAKHMPGDYDIEYASPWAGADYLPWTLTGISFADEYYGMNRTSEPGTDAAEWDRSPACKTYTRTKDVDSPTPKFAKDPWWKDMLPDYKEIPTSHLPPGISTGHSFTSLTINTAIYLPYLVSLLLASSVILKRAVFTHITDAAFAHHTTSPSPSNQADMLLNCTGLSSLTLPGVSDPHLYPIRGQTVLVRNASHGNFSLSGTDESDEGAYIMARAAGGGTVLGGCTQVGSWAGEVDVEMAGRIMGRAVGLCPELVGGKEDGVKGLDVIRHGVGLRPARKGGVRIESEVVDGVQVVHNYGHAGAGYQCSFGCAEVAVKLVDEALWD
ncbi:D-amino-acid oxidase [Lachnellula subtilissima]|uniref:D-amino-acid oxidase n=1 Tax=Lachnellula subtilissima TaxID=602034 RepID=A0A8H8RJG5_9HELO|nr:D-amino-acid oxidase [Lachnellula subtilissima]